MTIINRLLLIVGMVLLASGIALLITPTLTERLPEVHPAYKQIFVLFVANPPVLLLFGCISLFACLIGKSRSPR